jgi:hypothetical protein
MDTALGIVAFVLFISALFGFRVLLGALTRRLSSSQGFREWLQAYGPRLLDRDEAKDRTDT